MSSEFGKILKVSVFGESHGPAIGVLMDGLPAGESVDIDELQDFMNRRRPGQSALSTARKESDAPRFLSGLTDGRTNGFPLLAVIENADQRSGDYAALRDVPRPGHADYTAFIKWHGAADMRGGGHFSGRLTAPLCVAGGIAKQILKRRGIYVGSHLLRVADISDEAFPVRPTPELFEAVAAKAFPVLNGAAGERMQEAILKAREDLDSVGGVVECAAVGIPAGWGAPMFEGMESRLAAALFGIPAVKGVEFGAGFAAASMRGSQNNDAFAVEQGRVVTTTNHSGGILGGITNGMPLLLRVAFKPTPSIGREQESVSLTTGGAVALRIPGRHDPCVAHRAAPVAEAVTAAVLLDVAMENGLFAVRKDSSSWFGEI